MTAVQKGFATLEEAEAAAQQMGVIPYHSFDITPKMRDQITTDGRGLETMSADVQQPYRSATLTMEAPAPDLGQRGGDKFKDLVTRRMITGPGAPVSMRIMGGRETEQTMGQGSWHELVVKRLMDDAAKNGYDKVLIASGRAQLERYPISERPRAKTFTQTLRIRLIWAIWTRLAPDTSG